MSSLGEVPLGDVLPSGCATAEHDLRRLAHDLESRRSARGNVRCWCSPDHNMHLVRAGRWPVAERDELVAAFAAGAAMVTGVLDSGPFDPRPWRIEAGLPDAP